VLHEVQDLDCISLISCIAVLVEGNCFYSHGWIVAFSVTAVTSDAS